MQAQATDTDTITTTKFTPLESIQGYVIFVKNIHQECCEEDIYDLFADYGTIRSIALQVKSKTKSMPGYALVKFENRDDALSAIEETHAMQFHNSKLEVDWCFIQPLNNTHTKQQPPPQSSSSSLSLPQHQEYHGKRKREEDQPQEQYNYIAAEDNAQGHQYHPGQHEYSHQSNHTTHDNEKPAHDDQNQTAASKFAKMSNSH